MISPDFATTIALIGFIGAASHRITILQKKRIKYFSLLQILYIVIIPGLFSVFLLSHINSITSRPLQQFIIVPDLILTNMILLAGLFTYGGIVVHTVAKIYASPQHLRYDQTQTGQINKFFHLKFSHNLVFSGLTTMIVALGLLELNHYPQADQTQTFKAIADGSLFALSMISAMLFYTRPDKIFKDRHLYIGNWSDLKVTFALIWILFIFLLFGVRELNPDFKQYPLFFSTLIFLAAVAVTSIAIYIKSLRRKRHPAVKLDPDPQTDFV